MISMRIAISNGTIEQRSSCSLGLLIASLDRKQIRELHNQRSCNKTAQIDWIPDLLRVTFLERALG